MRKRRLLLEKFAVLLISIVALFVLLWLISLVDPMVEFSDSGLEEAILDKVGKTDPPIYRSDLSNITELDASGRGIKRLEGIEQLKRLTALNLQDNYLEDLNPLAHLGHLTELNLCNNQITDLQKVNFYAVKDLPLRKLSLHHNVYGPEAGAQLRLSDISLLEHLTELEELGLRDNHIIDISALSSLTALKVLDLRENRITDIRPLASLYSLEELNLRENDIYSIDPLSGLIKLRYLNIHSNQDIESIEPLSGLSNLETLIMRNVPVGEQVDVLSSLSNIKRLNIRNCRISDLSVINELMGLRKLQEVTAIEISLVIDVRDNIGAPEFSHAGGFYEEEFYLQLTPTVEGVNIYYTLDGSVPDPVNNIDRTYLYTEPLLIKNREGEPNILSLINPGYNDNWSGPPDNAFKATVVRAASFSAGIAASTVLTNTYFVDEGIYQRYRLPVVSLTTDPDNFFGYEQGIYVRGKAYEDTYSFWRMLNPDAEQHYQPANFHQRGRVIINAGGAEIKGYGLDRVALYMPEHGLQLDFSYLGDLPQISIIGTEHYDGFYYLDPASTGRWLVFEAPLISEIFPPGAQIIKNWERPVHFEFYEEEGTLAFSQELGVRIHGGASRSSAQKSLRFYARGFYDDQGIVDYKLFPGETQNSFKRFILRRSSDLNDPIGHLMMVKVNPEMDIQRYRPVVVFLNGEFWGLYALRDRHDNWNLALKYNLEPEDIAIVEAQHKRAIHFGDNTSLSDSQSFVVIEDHGNLKYGSSEDEKLYRQMDHFVRRSNLADPEKYSTLKTMIDIDNYTGWIITGIYLNYIDWGPKHTQVWRYRKGSFSPDHPTGPLDGRWRWLPVDLDCVITRGEGPQKDRLAEIAETELHYLKYLLENESYRTYFINRFADMLNTVFKEETVLQTVRDLTEELPEKSVEEHIQRWGYMHSLDGWNNYINTIEQYLQERPFYLRKHIIDYFGLSDSAQVKLKIASGEGHLEINTIKIKEETSGVENPQSWSGLYFMDIPVTITAVPAPGYIFKGWVEHSSDDQTISFVLTGDKTLTAVFIEDN